MRYLTCHTYLHIRELKFVLVESCPILGGSLSMCITCMEICSVPGDLSVVENCPSVRFGRLRCRCTNIKIKCLGLT